MLFFCELVGVAGVAGVVKARGWEVKDKTEARNVKSQPHLIL